MKLAVWLVEHTGEFTPGPWEVFREDDKDPVEIVATRIAGDAGPFGCVVAQVGCRALTRSVGVFEQDIDPERDANARLMADAPAMLHLLARVLEGSAAAYAKEKVVPESARQMLADLTALVGRHVRTGCAPVDEAARVIPINAYVHFYPREQK